MQSYYILHTKSTKISNRLNILFVPFILKSFTQPNDIHVLFPSDKILIQYLVIILNDHLMYIKFSKNAKLQDGNLKDV